MKPAETGARSLSGRVGLASANIGLVTSLNDIDLPYIQEALNSEAQPIVAAGILPPTHIVQRFASYFPPVIPFTYILRRLHALSRASSRFFLCSIEDQCEITEIIEDIPGLSVIDRYIIASSPAPTRDETVRAVAEALARCVAQQKDGGLLDVPEMPLEILDQPVSGDRQYLRRLEGLHRSLILYLWLSYRFGGVFTNRAMATHAKELVEEKIDRALLEFSANSSLRKSLLVERQKKMASAMSEEAAAAKLRQPGSDQKEAGEGLALPIQWGSSDDKARFEKEDNDNVQYASAGS